MRKSLLIMFLLFTVGMTANAQKFALIDMEYILKNIPAYQSATNELNQASKQWQSEVEKLGKEAKVYTTAIRRLSKPFPKHKNQRKKKKLLPKRNLRRNYVVNTSARKVSFSKSAKR